MSILSAQRSPGLPSGPKVGQAHAGARGRLAGSAVGWLWVVGIGLDLLYLLAFAGRFPLASHYQQLNDVAGLSGRSLAGAGLWLASELAAFALYALGWRLARAAGRAAVGPILATGLVAAAILGLMYPVTAIDQYVYLVHGRIWAVHGGNPLVQAPSAFPAEPLLGLTGEFTGAPAPYGPVWIMASGLIARLAGDDLLLGLALFKVAAVASYAACAGLIALALTRWRPASAAAGTLLFAWNPVVLIDVAGNGHNDATMMALATAAAVLWPTRWRVATPALLCLAALVKYVVGATVPLALLALWRAEGTGRERAARVALALGLCALAVAPVLWPFWAGPRTLEALLVRNNLIIGSPAALVLYLLHEPWPAVRADDVKLALGGLLVVAYAFQVARVWRGRATWLAGGLAATLAAIAAVPWFNSWFLVWPLAMAALLPGRAAGRGLIVFTLTALVAGVVLGHRGLWPGRGWTFEQAQAIGGALTFLPPLAAWSLARAAARRRAPA